MKRYVCFLRALNVGGRNKIAMADLKVLFSDLGYASVSTFQNSGNVVFTSEQTDEVLMKKEIEEAIVCRFGMSVPVSVISAEKLESILLSAPSWWGEGDKETYHNLILPIYPSETEDICLLLGKENADVEKVFCYLEVIFWSFERAQYRKSAWWAKTAAAGINEKMTIRTAGTIKKTLALAKKV